MNNYIRLLAAGLTMNQLATNPNIPNSNALSSNDKTQQDIDDTSSVSSASTAANKQALVQTVSNNPKQEENDSDRQSSYSVDTAPENRLIFDPITADLVSRRRELSEVLSPAQIQTLNALPSSDKDSFMKVFNDVRGIRAFSLQYLQLAMTNLLNHYIDCAARQDSLSREIRDTLSKYQNISMTSDSLALLKTNLTTLFQTIMNKPNLHNLPNSNTYQDILASLIRIKHTDIDQTDTGPTRWAKVSRTRSWNLPKYKSLSEVNIIEIINTLDNISKDYGPIGWLFRFVKDGMNSRGFKVFDTLSFLN